MSPARADGGPGHVPDHDGVDELLDLRKPQTIATCSVTKLIPLLAVARSCSLSRFQAIPPREGTLSLFLATATYAAAPTTTSSSSPKVELTLPDERLFRRGCSLFRQKGLGSGYHTTPVSASRRSFFKAPGSILPSVPPVGGP